MPSQPPVPGDDHGGVASDDGQVMASLDGEGTDVRLVIADVSRDDAWMSVATARAAPLEDWR